MRLQAYTSHLEIPTAELEVRKHISLLPEDVQNLRASSLDLKASVDLNHWHTRKICLGH